jgi:hypothetical protein
MHKPASSHPVPAGALGHRTFAPIAFDGSSRLTFRRLRRPTPLPTLSTLGGFGGYLGRLTWLFGSR